MVLSKNQNKEEKKGEETSDKWDLLDNLPPPYNPQAAATAAVTVTPSLREETGTVNNINSGNRGYPRLVKELEQCRKDLENFPLPGANTTNTNEAATYPLREVPLGPRQIGYANAPLSSGEVQNFKKEMKSLIEDPIGLAEQLDQFLGPNLYCWGEMMAILNLLFSGEERGMIRRAAMREWEKDHPPGDGVIPAEQKFPNVDPNWDNNNVQDRVNMRDFEKW